MNKRGIVKSISILAIILIVSILIFQIKIVTSSENLDEKGLASKINMNLLRQERIINEFDKGNEWVSISVNVFSEEMREEVISSLSELEFRDLRRELTKTVFSGEITSGGLDNLVDHPNVKWVNLQEAVSISLDDSIPLINANDVWSLGYSGYGQTICVIDTGVNASHPYLQGKIIAEYCYCRLYEGASPDCCPDGTDEDDDAEDNNGHGTHVTGIAVSNKSYVGVAPNASAVVVKVCNSSTENNCNNLDIASGITWCTNNADTYNISVITMSLSGGIYLPGQCIPTYADDEINFAVAAGIFVDASSGNNANTSGIGYPACSANATSVGASTKEDFIWSLTNRASNLDLLAPGEYIRSADYQTSGSAMMSGTSMAAPHVAGAAALLLEAASDLTPDEIRQILKDSGVTISDATSGLNFSRIDVLAALDYVCDKDGDGYDSESCSSGDDCNDYNANINLDSEEVCDGVDNDCDGNVDEGNICSPSIPTMLLCEGQPCTNNGTFSGSVEMNCSGSTDAENENITYFVYAYYNDSADAEFSLDYFNNSLQMENLTFSENENITRYLEIPRYANVTSAYINLSGLYTLTWQSGVHIQEQSFETVSNWDTYKSNANFTHSQSSDWKTDGTYSYLTELAANHAVMEDDWARVEQTGIDYSKIHAIKVDYNFSGSSDNNIKAHIIVDFNVWENTSQGSGTLEFDTSSITGTNPLKFTMECMAPVKCSYATRTYFYKDNIQEQIENYTINPYVQINNTNVWVHSGEFSQINNKTSDFTSTLNTALNSGACDCTGCSLNGDTCAIPILFHSDDKGILQYSSLNITYQSEYDWENIGNHTNTSTLNWNITDITEQSGVDLRCRAIDLNGSNIFSGYYNPIINLTITAIASNDTNKFYIHNSSNDAVAWLGDEGNIVLKGSCFSGGNCNTPGDNSFIVRNSTNNNVAFINSTGDLCVVTGDCSDRSASCNPVTDAFIIRNMSNYNMSYIDFTGDLCLTGVLYENSEP